MKLRISQVLLVMFFLMSYCKLTYSQTYAFSSGPIYMCDTNYFTANVSGLGVLEPPGPGFGYNLSNICINITSNHPQTLKIILSSPQGTNLLLSQFNGAGGSNYTGTCFTYVSNPSITTGSAPFTGNWLAQGGSLSVFDYEWADGIWTITVIDTACGSLPGIGGPMIDGFFDGTGGGGITMNLNPPYCNGGISNGSFNICQGETFDLAAYYQSMDPSLYYSFIYNGAAVSNPSAITDPGLYYIDATDPNFICFYSGSFNLIVDPVIVLGPDQTVDKCQGNSSNLSSLFNLVGTSSQLWTHNGAPISTASASAATLPGTYQVIGLTTAGCGDTAVVILNDIPSVTLGPNQVINGCTAGVFDLTGLFNTTGLTTSWTFSGAPVANPAAVFTNGTYTLIATNSGGCSDTASVTLSVTLGPSLGPDQTLNICSGSSANLVPLYSTGTNTIAWSFGGSPISNPSSVTNAGPYTLIVTNANGCSDTAIVTLNVQAAPVLGPNQTVNICSNTSTDLTGLFNTTGFNPVWTFNSVVVSNPAVVSASGNYTLIVSAGGGCADTAIVNLNYLQTPALGSNQTVSVCSGNNVNLTSLFNTSGMSTNWTLGGVAVTTPSAINTAGTYQIIAIDGTCSDTALVLVSVGSLPVLGPNQLQTICNNELLDLTNLFITTGYVVSWTHSGNPVPNPAAINSAGTYVLTVTNSAGCSSTASVVVSVNNVPALGPDQSINLCAGTIVDLTTFYSTSGLTSSWTENGNVVLDPTLITSTGNYQLVATNSNGCSDTAFVSVNFSQGPNLGPDQSYALCTWQTIDLGALYLTSGFTTTYSLNGQLITNVSSVYDSGTYAIAVTDSLGCTDEAVVIITNIICLCTVDFKVIATCIEEPVQLDLVSDSLATDARWTFSKASMPEQYGLNTSVFFDDEESILVTLDATLSCGQATTSKYVKVEQCEDMCHFYIPNSFTPNNDGVNDQLSFMSDCRPENYSLNIYDRFGKLLYQTENPDDIWDGNSQNKMVPEGVYVYFVEFKLPYQNKQSKKGTLMLLR